MSMQDRMAAASQRVQKLMTETKPAKTAKPRIRVRMGGVVTDDMLRAALGIKPKAVQQLNSAFQRLDLNRTVQSLRPGMDCPACKGTGTRFGNCYWCTSAGKPRSGWGTLTSRDIGFVTARFGGNAPLCDVIAA